MGPMEGRIPLGRVAGIGLSANWSVLVILWLVAWTVADGVLPERAPGYATAAYWIVGGVSAVAFFTCLLAHELGHAVVARKAGLRVDGITLWLFGGVSKLGEEAPDAATERRVGAAGPAVSVVLAVALGAVALALDGAGGPPLVVAAVGWLALMNGVLAVFNLLPAFPLDGGRLLRARVWARTGDRDRATAVAARAGRFLAYGLVGLGILQISAGLWVGGVWMAMIGWFLLAASEAEAGASTAVRTLQSLTAAEIMTPDPVTVPAGTSVDALLHEWVLRHHCSSFPVVAPDGSLLGLVTLDGLRRLPRDQRALATVEAVALPAGEVAIASPGDPLDRVLGQAMLWRRGGRRVLVLEHGRLVGIISPVDLVRAVQLAELAPASTGPVTAT